MSIELNEQELSYHLNSIKELLNFLVNNREYYDRYGEVGCGSDLDRSELAAVTHLKLLQKSLNKQQKIYPMNEDIILETPLNTIIPTDKYENLLALEKATEDLDFLLRNLAQGTFNSITTPISYPELVAIDKINQHHLIRKR